MLKGAVATSRVELLIELRCESESTYQTLVDEIFSKINKEYRQYKLHQRLLKNRSKETKLIYNHTVPVNFLMKSSHYIPSPFYASLRGNERKSRAYDGKKKRETKKRKDKTASS